MFRRLDGVCVMAVCSSRAAQPASLLNINLRVIRRIPPAATNSADDACVTLIGATQRRQLIAGSHVALQGTPQHASPYVGYRGTG
jgi:hypothetical protein